MSKQESDSNPRGNHLLVNVAQIVALGIHNVVNRKVPHDSVGGHVRAKLEAYYNQQKRDGRVAKTNLRLTFKKGGPPVGNWAYNPG